MYTFWAQDQAYCPTCDSIGTCDATSSNKRHAFCTTKAMTWGSCFNQADNNTFHTFTCPTAPTNLSLIKGFPLHMLQARTVFLLMHRSVRELFNNRHEAIFNDLYACLCNHLSAHSSGEICWHNKGVEDQCEIIVASFTNVTCMCMCVCVCVCVRVCVCVCVCV